MPTIVSRKNEDNIQLVSPEIWKQMQDKGLARRFKVIDDSDIANTIKETALPGDVKNFMDNVEKIEDVVNPVEEMSIGKIKSLLAGRKIEFEHGQKKEYYIKLIKNGD